MIGWVSGRCEQGCQADHCHEPGLISRSSLGLRPSQTAQALWALKVRYVTSNPLMSFESDVESLGVILSSHELMLSRNMRGTDERWANALMKLGNGIFA